MDHRLRILDEAPVTCWSGRIFSHFLYFDLIMFWSTVPAFHPLFQTLEAVRTTKTSSKFATTIKNREIGPSLSPVSPRARPLLCFDDAFSMSRQKTDDLRARSIQLYAWVPRFHARRGAWELGTICQPQHLNAAVILSYIVLLL